MLAALQIQAKIVNSVNAISFMVAGDNASPQLRLFLILSVNCYDILGKIVEKFLSATFTV